MEATPALTTVVIQIGMDTGYYSTVNFNSTRKLEEVAGRLRGLLRELRHLSGYEVDMVQVAEYGGGGK